MAGVFLSHASKDRGFVNRLAIDLTCKHIPVWLDTWEMGIGDSLFDRIFTGIDRSSFLIVIVSPASVESKWVQKELRAAILKESRGEGPFVLPLRLGSIEMPLLIGDRIYADFSESYSDAFEKLVSFLYKNHAHKLTIPCEKRIFPVVFTRDIFLDELKLRDVMAPWAEAAGSALDPGQVWVEPDEVYQKLRQALVLRIDNLRSDRFWTYDFEKQLQLSYRRVLNLESALKEGIAGIVSHRYELGYQLDWFTGSCHNFAKMVQSHLYWILYAVQTPGELVISQRSPLWFGSLLDDEAIETILGVKAPRRIDIGLPQRDVDGWVTSLGDGTSVQVAREKYEKIRENWYPQPLAEVLETREVLNVLFPQLLYKHLALQIELDFVWKLQDLYCGMH
jgi:hypothetical protein